MKRKAGMAVWVMLVSLLFALAGCGGGGGGSSTGGGGTDTAAPTAPSALVAAAAGSSSISLNWTASTDDIGVVGYKIYRGGTQVNFTSTNSFSDSGLAASTNYSYTVAAYDAAGNTSTQSISASATTLAAGVTDTTAPTVPADLVVTVRTASQLDLTWGTSTDAVGVTGYKVYRGGTYLKSATGTSSSDLGLTASTLYCYQISAYDVAENESNKGAEVCATTAAAAAGPGTNFKMPDTNQTTSYTTTFGEDHDYSINPPSYTDNGDGTITDNVTGLIWQKQDDGTSTNWDGAGTYCDASTLGGYSDWRLPSQIELISIIDNGVYLPSINTTFFPGTNGGWYWSSTRNKDSTSRAWYVDFMYGYSAHYVKGFSLSVRCVRGGQ